jgi:hypothetical protein
MLLPFNLFSLTKMMKKGSTIGGDSNKGINLKKDGIDFDISIETSNGVVYAMYMRRTEVLAPALPVTANIEKAQPSWSSTDNLLL